MTAAVESDDRMQCAIKTIAEDWLIGVLERRRYGVNVVERELAILIYATILRFMSDPDCDVAGVRNTEIIARQLRKSKIEKLRIETGIWILCHRRRERLKAASTSRISRRKWMQIIAKRKEEK